MSTQEVVAKNRYDLERPGYMHHETEIIDREAKFALTCIEKWGIVAAAEDGEDRAGRSKLRMLSEQEVVDRAVTMAELAFAAMREKNWIRPGMTWGEIESEAAKVAAKDSRVPVPEEIE